MSTQRPKACSRLAAASKQPASKDSTAILLTGALVAGLFFSNLVNAAALFERQDVFVSGHDGCTIDKLEATGRQ